MYRIVLIAFLSFIVNTTITSQYIADPSFEDYDTCNLPGQLNLNSWYSPTYGTPDNYTFACYTPQNVNLESSKTPNEFNGFIGFYLYDSLGSNYSEFIETALQEPLITGKEYCISIYVVASSRCNFNLSNIHIGFREDSVFQGMAGKLVVDTFYRLLSTPLKDTVNWTKLSIRFIAKGNEKYLSIGNFDTSENLELFSYNAQFLPPFLYRYAYYFFDLITLEECPPEPVEHFLVYPNPSSGGSVYLSNYADTVATVTLFNSLGQRVAERMLPAGVNGLVAFEGLASGVYIAVYQTATGYREEKKVVVL
jgi:hypothetical protein